MIFLTLTFNRKLLSSYILQPILIIFLLLVVSSATSIAQPKIDNIQISPGHSVFDEKFLLEKISSKKGEVFSSIKLNNDILKIAHLFSSECYYNPVVQIDSLQYSVDSSNVNVFISIVPGIQSRIGSVEITGNTAFNKYEILGNFETKAGSCLNQSQLESDIESLLSEYENNGYPFASVTIERVSISDSISSSLNVQVEINEGPKVKIDRIEVEGNTDTKAYVVVRETRIREGEIYNNDRVKNIPRLLNRLKIFSFVEVPSLYLIPDSITKSENNDVINPFHSLSVKKSDEMKSGGLLIKITEGSTNTFDGVVGYLPGPVGQKGYFTGLVDVGMRNLFGTGRKLSVKWMREDKYSQEIGIRYVEPWLLNYPVNLRGSFYQRQQDTVYIKRLTELKADFLLTENLTIGGMINQENIIPSLNLTDQSILARSTTSGGLEIHYDTRDDIYNPTAGINYRSDYYAGRKKIYSSKQAFTIQRIGLDVELFYQTFRRQVTALGLHGRELRGDEIEVSDLYRFGGTNTMRGYRENQFLGSRIVWLNLEYRFLMAKKSFFFGFFDFGYYFHPSISKSNVNTLSENTKYGYGVGMRIETGLGIIGVSFALGKGDNFSQAKLHFGLISDF